MSPTNHSHRQRRSARTGHKKGVRATKPAKRPAQPPVIYLIAPKTQPSAATGTDESTLAAYHALFPPDRSPRWTGTERPPISYYVALFDDPDFWRETHALFGAVGDVTEQALSDESFHFQDAWKKILQPFWYHYRAIPAVEFLPVHYRQGFSVMTVRWGVVPVYPWPKDSEIRASVHSIRKKSGQTRGEAEQEKHGGVGNWIKLHGFSSQEIAMARGRPSAGDRPRASSTQRPIAGSEPPLDAWLRMSRGRLRQGN